MKFGIRLLYLYLFAFVGLMTTIIGSVQLVDLGLKSYVFKVSEYSYYPETPAVDGKPVLSLDEVKKRNEKEQADQRKRQLSTSLAMIAVGAPVYLYHWKTIKKESKKKSR